MLSGFYGLTVMKTTQSGFVGYPKDRYTTLKETDRPDPGHRHLDQVALQRRAIRGDLDFNATYDSVKQTILTQLLARATPRRCSRICTRWPRPSSPRHDVIDEIKFSCPNKHHFLARPVAVRPGEPGRGLLRRRPAVRADRGDHPAQGQPDRGRGLGGVAGFC